MDWADEQYVKLFTRDTVTWNRWPWEAQAVLGPLMRRLNKAGVADIDERFGVSESVAALLGPKWPVAVVRPAVSAYLECGTFELVGGKLVMPNFLDAQESRKARQAIAHDYRQKQRDVARAKSSGLLKTEMTNRDHPRPSEPTVILQPSPSPAQPELLPAARKKPRAAAKPMDPRHVPLRTALIEAFRRKRGVEYPFDYGREDAEVRRLLKLGPEPAVLSAWERALDSTYPTISTLAKFRIEYPRFVGRGESQVQASPAKGASWTQPQLDDGKSFLEGLGG